MYNEAFETDFLLETEMIYRTESLQMMRDTDQYGPEDPERYQASITVSVQSQAHPFSSTSTSAIAYSPSTQYSSYSSSF